MSACRIFETRQFQRDVEALAHAGQAALLGKLHTTVYSRLRGEPHFGTNVRKLKGFEPDTWRYRIGAWRFFYEIDEKERLVILTAAAHRGSAY